MLGADQHGHINAVGFDYYLLMLKNAIAELKGQEAETAIDPEINLQVAAFIPDSYIADSRARVGYYRRLSAARQNEELSTVRDELRDRFGAPPRELENLVALLSIRIQLVTLGVRALDFGNGNLVLTLSEGSRIPIEVLIARVSSAPKRYKLTPEGRFVVRVEPDAAPLVVAAKLAAELVAQL